MSTIDDISTERFDAEVTESSIPVFVDFHAVWCGPCKAAMPALLDMAREFESEVRIVKIDIDAEPDLAARFSVKGVPTFLLIADGEVRERFSGALTRGRMSALFERYSGENR